MTITVTPTVELSNVPPRVRLDITASAGETSTTITRLNGSNVVYTVRTSDGAPLTLSGGTGLLYDYEAPFGQGVQYSSVESPATISAQVTVDESRVWLIHPGVPSISMPVTVRELGARTRRVTRGVFYPLGRANAVVQTDGQRKSPEWTLTLLTQTQDETDSLIEICDDAGVLLLNIPLSKGWGMNAEYVSVGDLTTTRVARFAGDPMRSVELPLIVVDRPAGGTQAQRTYTDVIATYATYSAVRTKYATYSALLAGP